MWNYFGENVKAKTVKVWIAENATHTTSVAVDYERKTVTIDFEHGHYSFQTFFNDNPVALSRMYYFAVRCMKGSRGVGDK